MARMPTQSDRQRRHNAGAQRRALNAVRQCHACGRRSIMATYMTEIGRIYFCHYCKAARVGGKEA